MNAPRLLKKEEEELGREEVERTEMRRKKRRKRAKAKGAPEGKAVKDGARKNKKWRNQVGFGIECD